MPTKVKLTNARIQALFVAIGAMDGRDEVAIDKDGKVLGILKKPYEFEDGKARYAMAKTRNLLREHVIKLENSINEARKELPQTEPDPSDTAAVQAAVAKTRAFSDSTNEMMQAEVEVEVWQVEVSKLKIDTNKISPAIVEDLMPILTGEL